MAQIAIQRCIRGAVETSSSKPNSAARNRERVDEVVVQKGQQDSTDST